MPFFIGVCGFGGRSTARDRLIVTTGAVTYSTTVLPTASESTTSAGGSGVGFRAPWYDNAGGQNEATQATGFHARYYTSVNSATANDTLRIGIGRDGTAAIAVSAEDSTNKLTLRVGAFVRATATSAAFSIDVWARVHVLISGWAENDTVRVYLDGDLSTPVIDYTLTSTDESNLGTIGDPNEFTIAAKNGDGGGKFDDLVAWNTAAANAVAVARLAEVSVKEVVFTGDGSQTDWGGSYADIDERPASDTDKITATAVGDESLFVKAAIGVDNVFAVKVAARVTRTGTDAGSNVTVEVVDGADDEQVTVAAPGDGDVSVIFEVGPDGNPWSPASFDACEIGFLAAT